MGNKLIVCNKTMRSEEKYLPSQIKNYTIIQSLGKGAFGEVLLVLDPKDNQLFALKKVPLIGLNLKERLDAAEEASKLMMLQNSNVIGFHETFIENDNLNIIMQFCEGGDLNTLIKKNKDEGRVFSIGEIIYVAQQLAAGIKYLHMSKIIHRDLKPKNILITKDSLIKIADLGLAKAMKSTNNQAKSEVGTPLYMAPEILKGKNYTFAVDIWAFGCIVYELCELRHPFAGDYIGIIFNKILSEDYSKNLRKLPKCLNDIISGCLEKNPNEISNKRDFRHSKKRKTANIAYFY